METHTIVIISASSAALLLSLVFLAWACWCHARSRKVRKPTETVVATALVE